jgi:hypothetical protein
MVPNTPWISSGQSVRKLAPVYLVPPRVERMDTRFNDHSMQSDRCVVQVIEGQLK